MSTFRIALLAASAAALSVPGTASAVVSCDYDKDQKRVDVTLTANENFANIQRNGADEIRVSGSVCSDQGVIANVHNTDGVYVNDVSGGNTTVGIDLLGGPFAPGADNEGDGDSEIEFFVNGGAGLGDDLLLLGSNGNDVLELGDAQANVAANLNAGAEQANPDVDVATTGINIVSASTTHGDDTVTGSGADFDGPVPVRMELDGGHDDDFLVGGDASDLIDGYHDTDALGGGAGHDELIGSQGKDYLEGGPGIDEADYDDASSGVTVDLRTAGFQQTGGGGEDALTGIENLQGSDHGDVLIGRDGKNVFSGGNGADVLDGGPGDDVLDGNAGADTLSYASAGAGVKVSLSAGAAQDTGGSGTDDVESFQHLTGSPFADELAGGDAENTIDGGAGGDELSGLLGDDTLLVRDGEGDRADCGGGIDAVTTDAPGVDTLVACENVDALPAPVVPQPDPPVADQPPVVPPAPGPGPTPSGGPTADTTAPVISALRRRGRRLTLRVSERSRLAILVTRDRGRRARPRFQKVRSLSRSGVAGANRMRLPRLRPGCRYRVVVVATDAAGNRSVKRSVSFRVTR